MRKMPVSILVVLTMCFLTGLSWSAGGAPASYSDDRAVRIPGQYIVRFADGVELDAVVHGFGLFRLGVASVDRIFDDYGATAVRPMFPSRMNKADDLSRFYLVKIGEGRDAKQFLDVMTANPNILSIEQDIKCPVDAVPNDPGQTNQWWVYQASRADIHAREAWDIEAGSDTAVIAIIDTGVLYYHPDLRNNIWVNPGEDIDGDMIVFDSTDINSFDDDGNGYTDDFVGYDFLSGGSGDAWPGEDGGDKDNDPKDFNGHGTHCAGIAAAVTNNGEGGCGTAGGWDKYYAERGVSIMCLRAGYSGVDPDDGHETGWLVMSAVAEAINYAVDNGADVISFSAGSSFTSALYTAMNRVMAAGIVFCYSAGNDGDDMPDYLGTFDGVLAVANTTSGDSKYASSDYGTWVDVAAPGANIYSTDSDHYTVAYAYKTGTSMAAPMVAGLAGLIKSHFPDYDKTLIDALIVDRADSIDDYYYHNGLLGGGRINAYNCLADAPVARFAGSPRYGEPGVTVTFTDLSPAATSWSWDFGDGGVSTDQSPTHQYTAPGYYTVTLEVTDPNGTDVEVKKSYILVSNSVVWAEPIFSPANEDIMVPLRLTNDVPIDYFVLPLTYPAVGSPTLALDSFTVVGTRTEYFEVVDKPGQSSSKVVLTFDQALPGNTGQDALPPGDGVIVNLWFSPGGAGQLYIDTTTYGGSYQFEFENRTCRFQPRFEPVSIYLTIFDRGDANGDSDVNVGDAVYLINYAFKGGWPPVDFPAVYTGDANYDFSVNVGDAVYLINYVFKGGPPPPP